MSASGDLIIKNRRYLSKETIFAYLLILPTFGLTFLFTDYPLLRVLHDSLFHGTLFGGPGPFVGFQNFVNGWTNGGRQSLLVTLKFTLGFVLLSTVLGLCCSLLLGLRIRGIQAFRTPFIVPLVVPVIATGFVWVALFNPTFGYIDKILSLLGFGRIDWYNDPRYAIITVILFSTWQYVGQNVILFLAALKALPIQFLESAEVDGAGPLRKLWYVTLPLLLPNIALILVLTTIASLQVFTQIYVLTQGGPMGTTTTTAFFIYQQAFQLQDTGTADAWSVILFLITLAITVLQMMFLRILGAEGYE